METLTLKNTSGFTKKELNVLNEANETLDTNFDDLMRVYDSKKHKTAESLINDFNNFDFKKDYQQACGG